MSKTSGSHVLVPRRRQQSLYWHSIFVKVAIEFKLIIFSRIINNLIEPEHFFFCRLDEKRYTSTFEKTSYTPTAKECLSPCLSVCLPARLPAFLPSCLPVCLTECPSVCPFLCLCVCL